jgi:hypothetical protein
MSAFRHRNGIDVAEDLELLPLVGRHLHDRLGCATLDRRLVTAAE